MKGRHVTTQEHVHTGPIAFLFAGLSAVIFIQLVKIASAEMVKHPGILEQIGKVSGSLIQTD